MGATTFSLVPSGQLNQKNQTSRMEGACMGKTIQDTPYQEWVISLIRKHFQEKQAQGVRITAARFGQKANELELIILGKVVDTIVVEIPDDLKEEHERARR